MGGSWGRLGNSGRHLLVHHCSCSLMPFSAPALHQPTCHPRPACCSLLAGNGQGVARRPEEELRGVPPAHNRCEWGMRGWAASLSSAEVALIWRPTESGSCQSGPRFIPAPRIRRHRGGEDIPAVRAGGSCAGGNGASRVAAAAGLRTVWDHPPPIPPAPHCPACRQLKKGDISATLMGGGGAGEGGGGGNKAGGKFRCASLLGGS